MGKIMDNYEILLQTGCFNDSVFKKLPEKLKTLTTLFTSKREKDLILLSSITVISSLFDNYFVKYDRDKLYSNLYLMVVAPPASSKGIVKHTRNIAVPFDEKELELTEKSDSNKTKHRMFIIPGNISYAGLLELLQNNGNKGLIFETETDVINNVKNNEWGDYSSLLRKAFHHESEKYFRATEKKYIDIKMPKLSVVLTGTLEQFVNFFPSTENGLYSRFMCYIFAENEEWKDVFDMQNNDISLEDEFKSLGDYILENIPQYDIEFTLLEHQKELFKEYFDSKYKTFSWLEEGNESIVRRMGIIATRIAMVLTMIRNIGDITTDILICCDDDFEITLDIIEVLLKHTEIALKMIPDNKHKVRFKNNIAKDFFQSLPNEFKREDILNKRKIPLSRSSFDRMLSDGTMFQSLGNGNYRKREI